MLDRPNIEPLKIAPLLDELPQNPVREERVSENFSYAHLAILLLIHVGAVAALFVFTWQGFVFFLVGHILTGLGVSVGYHRLLAHRGFKTHPWIEGVLALLGTLSMQSGPITWSAFHRAHHATTDLPGDPHSSSRGFWYSHLGWMFFKKPNGFSRQSVRSQNKDLLSSRWLRFLDRNFLRINLAAALAFFLVTRRLDWTLWAFPARIAALWHCTWLVNSAAHGARGPRQYSGDTSRNLWWLAALTYGEGWHANHHHKPKAWSFRREWYQFDAGAAVISTLKALKLAR